MSVERAFEQIRDAEKRRRVSQIRAVQPLSPCLGVRVSASQAFVYGRRRAELGRIRGVQHDLS